MELVGRYGFGIPLFVKFGEECILREILTATQELRQWIFEVLFGG